MAVRLSEQDVEMLLAARDDEEGWIDVSGSDAHCRRAARLVKAGLAAYVDAYQAAIAVTASGIDAIDGCEGPSMQDCMDEFDQLFLQSPDRSRRLGR